MNVRVKTFTINDVSIVCHEIRLTMDFFFYHYYCELKKDNCILQCDRAEICKTNSLTVTIKIIILITDQNYTKYIYVLQRECAEI